jgi:mycothiol synthase
MTERPVPGSAAAGSDFSSTGVSSTGVSSTGVSSTGVIAAGLTTAQVDGVLALARAAAAADGVAPLSEHVLLHLRYDHSSAGPEPGGAASQDITAVTGGEIAGYAHLDRQPAEASGELVVHPDRRGRGLGRALVSELTTAADGRVLRIWAHGEQPAAARLAAATGFERFRALAQMRRPLRDWIAAPAFPAGRTLRTFIPGQDEDEWLTLNGRAFAKHPEQGSWTSHDLELREREPWFDPSGFFIAERDGAMAGFHWTKVHPAGGPDSPDRAIGEVYVVGVDPAEQGSGLGRALTLAGLHHLRDEGLAEVMLYVDEDNIPAIRLYEALGFSRARTDAMYQREPQREF